MHISTANIFEMVTERAYIAIADIYNIYHWVSIGKGINWEPGNITKTLA